MPNVIRMRTIIFPGTFFPLSLPTLCLYHTSHGKRGNCVPVLESWETRLNNSEEAVTTCCGKHLTHPFFSCNHVHTLYIHTHFTARRGRTRSLRGTFPQTETAQQPHLVSCSPSPLVLLRSILAILVRNSFPWPTLFKQRGGWKLTSQK